VGLDGFSISHSLPRPATNPYVAFYVAFYVTFWKMLTAVENGGAGRSKMVALGGVDLP
jgi:hypothetical protein